MSLFSTNRFKNLSAEYVEESLKVQKETIEAKENDKTVDITECEDSVDEAVDIDALLESLND